MSWISEEPIFIFMTGLLFMTGFGAFAFVTGKRLLWTLFVVSMVAMIGMLVFESLVVTDREKLNNALDSMLVCVRNNDIPGLLEHGSQSRVDTKARLENEVRGHKVVSAGLMHRKQPVIDTHTRPLTASMEFTGFGQIEEYAGTIMQGVRLEFQKDPDGQWRVIDFELYNVNPLGGRRQ